MYVYRKCLLIQCKFTNLNDANLPESRNIHDFSKWQEGKLFLHCLLLFLGVLS